MTDEQAINVIKYSECLNSELLVKLYHLIIDAGVEQSALKKIFAVKTEKGSSKFGLAVAEAVNG